MEAYFQKYRPTVFSLIIVLVMNVVMPAGHDHRNMDKDMNMDKEKEMNMEMK